MAGIDKKCQQFYIVTTVKDKRLEDIIRDPAIYLDIFSRLIRVPYRLDGGQTLFYTLNVNLSPLPTRG